MNNNISTHAMQPTRVKKSGGAGWMAGLLLILLGAGFMMQSQGLYTFPFENWWALFILVPVLGSFEQAGQHFRDNGNRLVRSAGGSLLSGILLILVCLAFLFNLNWAMIGPLLIVLAGLGILINSALPEQ